MEKTTPKKLGRKPKLDPELVAATLTELRGNVAEVAKRFNVARSSVHQLINNRSSLQVVIHDAREGMKDAAENSLYKAVEKGEAWAVCFYLKTQAKDRGYIERRELTGADGQKLSPLVIFKGDDPDAEEVSGIPLTSPEPPAG